MGFRIGRARAQHTYPDPNNLAAAAVLLAHKWADNGQTVVTVGAGFPATVAFVTVTPRVTGKFRVVGTAAVSNASTGVAHTAQAVIGRGVVALGVLPTTIDYTVGSAVVMEAAAAGNADVVQVAVVFELTAAIPINVPLQINFAIASDGAAGTDVTVHANSAQISVQELSN